MKLNNHNKTHGERTFLLLSIIACLSGLSVSSVDAAGPAKNHSAVHLSIQATLKQPAAGRGFSVTVTAENRSRFPVSLTGFLLQADDENRLIEMAVIPPSYQATRDLYGRVVGTIDDKRAVVQRTYRIDASKLGPLEFKDGSVAAPGRAPRPAQWKYAGKDELVHFKVLMPGEETSFVETVSLRQGHYLIGVDVDFIVLDETLPIMRRSAFEKANLLRERKPGDRVAADPDGFIATSHERAVYKWTTVGELAKFKKPFVEGRQPVPNPDPVKLPASTPNEQMMRYALPRAEFRQLRAGKFFVTSSASSTVEVDATP